MNSTVGVSTVFKILARKHWFSIGSGSKIRVYNQTTLQHKQVLLPQSTHSGASLIQGRGASLIAPLVGNRVNHSQQPYTNLSLYLTLKLILLFAYFTLVPDNFSLFYCLTFREQYYTRKEEMYFVFIDYYYLRDGFWLVAAYPIVNLFFLFLACKNWYPRTDIFLYVGIIYFIH